MYKIFNALLGIIWVMDIFDFPCVEFLDTTCPINNGYLTFMVDLKDFLV